MVEVSLEGADLNSLVKLDDLTRIVEAITY